MHHLNLNKAATVHGSYIIRLINADKLDEPITVKDKIHTLLNRSLEVATGI